MNDIVIPQCLDLEEAVLGACLCETKAFPRARQVINNRHFYIERHQIIFAAMEALSARGGVIDLLTVTQELNTMGKLADAGGPYGITQLSSKVASSAHLEEHALIMREYHTRRLLMREVSAMTPRCADLTEDIYDTLYSLSNLLTSILSDAPMMLHVKSMKEVMQLSLNALEERRAREKNGVTGSPTGLPELDRLTGGLQKGELVVIGGRPGTGKTAFMLHLVKNAALDAKQVLLASLEMSARHLGDRLLLGESDIDSHAWKSGKISEDDFTQAQEAAEVLSELNIQINDKGFMTVDDFCAQVKLLHAQGQCDIAALDYGQLLTPSHTDKHNRNREQEVADISRKCKLLAIQLNIPVILLSQLNRQAEGRSNFRPSLGDLRESGAMEQDADVVILLYRPILYGIMCDPDTNYPTQNMGHAIIAKNRNGETGDIVFGHNDSMTRFGEYAPPGEWLLQESKRQEARDKRKKRKEARERQGEIF